jgi:23S rRNA (uridine2552-2'-O)-methyltransferase
MATRTSKSPRSKTFIDKGNSRYDRHDPYYQKAKKEGFAARSIYKLDEIDRDVSLIKKGNVVVDLGCAPGSWLQYAEEHVLPGGRVYGIDLLPVKLSFAPHVRILQGDAFLVTMADLFGVADAAVPAVDVVLSDMAPNTTGIRSVDQDRSMALCERALDVAARLLKPGGRFCVKVFEGGDMKAYLEACKAVFEQVKIKRPKSVRVGSMETYVVGLSRRASPPAG